MLVGGLPEPGGKIGKVNVPRAVDSQRGKAAHLAQTAGDGQKLLHRLERPTAGVLGLLLKEHHATTTGRSVKRQSLAALAGTHDDQIASLHESFRGRLPGFTVEAGWREGRVRSPGDRRFGLIEDRGSSESIGFRNGWAKWERWE